MSELRLPHMERFNDNARKALEYALRDALMHGDNYIGPQHILAGLTRLLQRDTPTKVVLSPPAFEAWTRILANAEDGIITGRKLEHNAKAVPILQELQDAHLITWRQGYDQFYVNTNANAEQAKAEGPSQPKPKRC